ncbi:hypothetical protein BST97_07220 [Nonlabens spongiae]|uniref:SMI1/KNR4 family protein n=1 Tax=Nonlabens spongiae TaxID=331648 RepID=A0A1W6MJX1_9FLAO|nr:hypothetical protein [Nonlabens spongiae]ARN77806.1 hypothetical protein BST97_07220 [Nonlabens spongiae]
MEYEFSKKPYGQDGLFGVKYDSLEASFMALFEINSHLWTAEKIQLLIDKSLSLKNDEEYEYKGDGSNLFMIIDKNEVFFYSSYSDKEEEDFIWPFDKFIQFLEDFKQFVTENQ